MKRLRPWLALIAILWLATGLRFYRLDAQSFWNDEGNSASLSARPVELIVEGTASDIHPPLYYLLLHGWRQLVGESEFGLRAFSAFAGVLLVGGTFALGYRLSAGWTLSALLAALAAALNPALIYYSQEVRMYELLALLAVLSTLSLWLSCPWLAGWRRGWPYALPYLLLVVAGLYTHYFFAAVLLAHNALVLFWLLSRWSAWRRTVLTWTGLMLLLVLAYLPWLPVFLRQTGSRSGDEIGVLAFLQDAARWLAFGGTIEAGPARWPLLAFALLLLSGLIPVGKTVGRARRNARRYTQTLVAILSLLVIPLLFMFLAGTTRPAYLKFLIVAVPFLALLVGRGAGIGWEMARRAPVLQLPLFLLLTAVTGGALWGSGRSLANLYFNPAYARDNYRAMAAAIVHDAHPNAGIILNAPNQWEVFTYYYHGADPVYPIPRGEPDHEQLTSELEEIVARHDRLYALFWGEAERDPVRPVERWLDQHAYKARDEWVGGVRFVTYAVPREPATEPETATALHFGERITLTGYTLRGEQSRPGEIIEVTLFWVAERSLTTRYKVFLHLLNDKGELVAQRDGEPGGGLAPTDTWVPGERITDNYGLLVPPSLSPGTYYLRLGLYEVGNPDSRLPLSAENVVADAYPLATVTILP